MRYYLNGQSARCPAVKVSEYEKGGRPYCTPTSAIGQHKTACGYTKRALLFVVVVVDVAVVPSAVVPGTVYATLKGSPPHFPHPWPAL
jgi:hypothetical protein